ncbi:hypothetical protein, partial [Aeromonas caviae]|uniref:hypothetical protein n=1 Tax=Aeromonas caviae TaxID=648 RepID=UPI002B49AF02
VTWGWGSCGLMVDLGNSAGKRFNVSIGDFFRWLIFIVFFNSFIGRVVTFLCESCICHKWLTSYSGVVD